METKLNMLGLRFGTLYLLDIVVTDRSGNRSIATSTSFRTQYAAEAVENIKMLDNAENFQDQLESIIDSVLPSLVPPQIADVTSEDITENSVTINWNTNSKTFGSVLYSPEDEFKKISANSSTSPYTSTFSDIGVKGRSHSVSITNLRPLTTYHFKVSAFAIFGVSAESKDFTFTTKAPKVLPEISNVTNTGFTVFWTTTDPATSIVEYKNLRNGIVNRVTNEERVTNHTVVVQNLPTDTSFELRIFGYTANGGIVEALRSLRVKTRLDITPPNISNVTISNTIIPNRNDRLQTVVTWKTDEPTTSEVAFQEGTGASLSNPQFTDSPGIYTEDHAVILTRFRQGTVYRVQVSSRDIAGNTSSSTVKTILTPKESESVFNVILKNFDESFGYLNSNR